MLIPHVIIDFIQETGCRFCLVVGLTVLKMAAAGLLAWPRSTDIWIIAIKEISLGIIGKGLLSAVDTIYL